MPVPADAQALDGADLLPRAGRNRHDARARRFVVDMHRAGAARGHAAPELGASEPKMIAQDPKQRRFGFEVEVDRFAVYDETDHALSFLLPGGAARGACPGG